MSIHWTSEQHAAAVKAARLDATKKKPDRQPGEPACRCLWCNHYRCEAPMLLCDGCQRKYEEARKRLPKVRSKTRAFRTREEMAPGVPPGTVGPNQSVDLS
jgi:hypothetical protein